MTTQIVNFTPKRELLKVEQGMVVTLKYALFDQHDGDLIEYRDNLVYLHGGKENDLLKLQQAIEGFKVGMKTDVLLDAKDAFGIQNPELLLTMPKAELPPEARHPGAGLEGEAADGSVHHFTVAAIDDDLVTLDGNHPMAGRDLKFVVEIVDIREATKEELETGHAFHLDRSGPDPEQQKH